MAQPTVNQIHKLLIKTKKTIAVAESCSGGLLSNLLTSLPGSSKYFILGVVAYSNRSKSKILKIPASLILKNGAVSSPVAGLMASRIRKIAGVDLGIGITGIAGPGGETTLKPKGTVFIAVAGKNRRSCNEFHFTGNRNAIRKKSALKALELLTRII